MACSMFLMSSLRPELSISFLHGGNFRSVLMLVLSCSERRVSIWLFTSLSDLCCGSWLRASQSLLWFLVLASTLVIFIWIVLTIPCHSLVTASVHRQVVCVTQMISWIWPFWCPSQFVCFRMWKKVVQVYLSLAL